MAQIKKNAIAQVLFTMVDKTDFATVESALTSNFTVSLFGTNHGAFAAASDITVSRSVSVVKSGIYKAELKAAETNWDMLMLKITHASAADQMIVLQTVTNDDEDINSRLVLAQSNISDVESQLDVTASKVLLIQSNVSDIDSQLLLNASIISDIQSALDSDIVVRASQFSDIQSNVDAVTASVSASDISDIASAVWAAAVTTHGAAAGSFGSLVRNTKSLVSDVDSQLLLNASMISDVASTLDSDIVVRASQFSDIQSNIDAVTASVSASDISDIASAVKVIQASRLSDILSAAVQTNSRVLVLQSRVSDIDSQLLLNASVISDIQSAIDSDIVVRASQFSDIQSNIDAVAATISASDISDIVSAVWAAKHVTHSLASSFGSMVSVIATNAASGSSRALINQSRISDVDSQLLLNASMISDIDSQLLLNASMISDVDSQLTITASKVVLIQSSVSDVESQLDITASKVLLIQSQVSDIDSQIDAGVQLASGQTASWASSLEKSAGTILEGTATGTPTTTTMAATGLTESTDDHFNGRTIIWTSGVLKDQATDITDYTGATDLFTFTAVTEAATAGDTFVIV